METPPPGYANDATQVLSQLNPATSVNSSTIQVTVVNPSNVYIAIDESQFLNRNAWDEVQQTLNYTNAEVTHGSNVVTMANTSPMLVGDSVTITVGSTTLNSTITSISANDTP